MIRGAQQKSVRVVRASEPPVIDGRFGDDAWEHASVLGALTQVEPLAGDERVDEIARMLAGAKVTDEARAAANSLLAGERTAAAAL